MKLRLLTKSFLFFFFSFSFFVHGQTPLGQNFQGSSGRQYIGTGVSVNKDGEIIAISRKNLYATSSSVSIYSLNASTSQWDIMGSPISYGYKTSLSDDGKTIAIGNPNDGIKGSAKVFQLQGSGSTASWVQLGNTIEGVTFNDSTASSISLSGDGTTVAIRSNGNGKPTKKGRVIVYKIVGSTWTKLGNPLTGEDSISNNSMNFNMGNDPSKNIALDQDGNRIAIGTYNSDKNGKNSGHVRVFEWNGTSWSQLGTALSGLAKDHFGYSVDISNNGEKLLVGAPQLFNHSAGGYVNSYSFDGSIWNLTGSLLRSNTNSFGKEVSMSDDGDHIAVLQNFRPTQVQLYYWGSNMWNPSGNPIPMASTNLELSGDASTLIIGNEDYHLSETNQFAGKAQAYATNTTANVIARCLDLTVSLNPSTGTSMITASQIDNSSTVNNGTPSLSIDKILFDCTNIGVNTVTLTVTDGAGNTDTCTATVTIVDDTPPHVIDNALQMYQANYGETSKIITYTPPIATDLCGSVTMVQTGGIASGDPFPIGTTTNYFIFTDTSGNTISSSFDVFVNSPPNVVINSGSLTFNDKASLDNDITLSIDGSNYRLASFIPGALTAGAGATQDNNDVLVPIASVSNTIDINTGEGKDKLTINFNGVNYPHPIIYHGGEPSTAPGDSLEFTGNATITTAAYTAFSANSGSIALTGNALITYYELEPIYDNLIVENRIFNFNGGSEVITLYANGNNENIIDSELSESIIFSSPTNSLVINTTQSKGQDDIDVSSLTPNFNAAFTINAKDNDLVHINQMDFETDKNLSIEAGIIIFLGNFTGLDKSNFTLNAESYIHLDSQITTTAGDITMTVKTIREDFNRGEGAFKSPNTIIHSESGTITLPDEE